MDPQSVVPESVMPKYAFLARTQIDGEYIGELMETHRFVGVPYTDVQIEAAYEDFMAQADPEGDYGEVEDRYPGAAVGNFDGQPELTEMDALIAYMQVLGTMVDFSTFTPEPSR